MKLLSSLILLSFGVASFLFNCGKSVILVESMSLLCNYNYSS